MKKFNQNDVLNNTIKTYPKVKIFSYCGKHYYNNEKEDGPNLNDFLLSIPVQTSPIPVGAISTELEALLLTEDNEFIVIE